MLLKRQIKNCFFFWIPAFPASAGTGMTSCGFIVFQMSLISKKSNFKFQISNFK